MNSGLQEENMNTEIYWKIRKTIITAIFKIKRALYRIIDYMAGRREYTSFRKIVVKNSIIGLFKALLLTGIVIGIDASIHRFHSVPIVNENIFVPSVIGGISVAGVILGLYCANITSIYSSRYANAPREIANAFQYDRLTRKCISSIVNYIIFGFLLICASMFTIQISWISVIVFIFWSIVVIVSYSIAGNRAHQLSDVYGVATDANRILYRILSTRLQQKMFDTDVNFQNHFLKVAEKQIKLLDTIQKYGISEKRDENSDNASMTEFMLNNLVLIQSYWKNKRNISRSSFWFRNTPRYQKWHFTNDTESSLALRTGTSLRTKEEHDYWWFEDELISINKACLKHLFEQKDFSSLYSYMSCFEQMCSSAIEYREAEFYLKQVDWIKSELEKQMISAESEGKERNAFAGVIEIVSLLYLDIILESGKAYQNFDVESIASDVIKAIDSGKEIEKIECLRGKHNNDFYSNIITEVKVEGKRISPEWVIKQQIAKEEYVYLNTLLDIVREGMDHAFSLGEMLSEKKLFFEACIILTRFYEYESNLNTFVEIVKTQKEKLEKYHIDKKSGWDEFRLQKLQNTMREWKKTIPAKLFESSSQFALDNWKNRDEFPDFLGECYNHICEDAIEAVIDGDLNQFAVDFDNLSKLMLLYQEYVRSDFIKNKDFYRIEYAYYMATSPIVEWAQIGGLAILWGEFHSDNEWNDVVKKSSDSLFVKDGKSTGVAERLIEYVQHRKRFMVGIAGRDILETGWKQGVENAIRNSGMCEIEYEMFYCTLKTESKLLKAFCPNFMDMGFSADPSEIFWVLCVNPFLAEEKRFHTEYSWEDKLYE